MRCGWYPTCADDGPPQQYAVDIDGEVTCVAAGQVPLDVEWLC